MGNFFRALLIRLMMKPNKTLYESFEEWKMDLERVHQAPNDKHLIAHVSKCVANSSEDIRKQVKEHLLDATLEHNPMAVFRQAAAENPNHRVTLKSEKDPWFNC